MCVCVCVCVCVCQLDELHDRLARAEHDHAAELRRLRPAATPGGGGGGGGNADSSPSHWRYLALASRGRKLQASLQLLEHFYSFSSSLSPV